ncbi:uncharacterized protein LOC123547930 [Mercenaria mercenaria]|uniref:uncharacterized protein LOC123547930 n=1 Tax=Mercenaria mercenaria TaxID=6596 RepID=UPI00234EB13C|nr:uncharacterized protein LOC123547930 [Mercenaria mercenaria]
MTTNWSAIHRDHCMLWTPTYNTLPIAEKNTFARGNFTTAQNNGTLLNKFFWVNLIVQENNPSQLPVVGNILRCGYIAYNIPNIYYTDCFKKKAFICKTDKSQSLSTLSAGLYVGISVTLVVIVTACVVAVIFILRKRRSLGAEKLPHGGKSFTRRNKNNSDDNGQANAGFKDENRITTYNQIDLDHMKSNPPNESSEENFDIIDNMFHPTYSIVYKKGRNENKPDVIPRNTKKKNTDVVNPGYLAMDGRRSDQCIDGVNKEYDFLESTRSTSSTRYKQIDTDTAGNHVYSSTTCSINEATYDVTSHRSSSKRNPVDEDYDHVMVVTSSETMSRNMCDSIGEKTPSVNMQMSIPRSNPGYDRVVIK